LKEVIRSLPAPGADGFWKTGTLTAGIDTEVACILQGAGLPRRGFSASRRRLQIVRKGGKEVDRE
jgi:hypothetical protein